MNTELFKKIGVALWGDAWKSQMQRALGLAHRQRISQWLSGERPIPKIEAELLATAKVRRAEIDSAIDALEANFVEDKVDFSESFFVIVENDYVLEERFDTLEEARAWYYDDDEDDDYPVVFREMSLAEHLAREIILHYSDVYETEKVLETINDELNASEKTAEQIYRDIALLDDNYFGKEYYRYYLNCELQLSNKMEWLGLVDEEDYEEPPCPVSYRQFIISKITGLSKFVAENL